MSATEITVTPEVVETELGQKSNPNQNAGDIEAGAKGDASNPEFRLQKRGKIRPRACKPFQAAFDSRSYVEVILNFNALKNFQLKESPKPGQYVVRASCMGNVYGHFVSKPAKVQSGAPVPELGGDDQCQDISIDEELFFYIRFKEMIDNPILLSLLDTSGTSTTEYDKLIPIGYICLDIAQILSLGPSLVEMHTEPWVIVDREVLKMFLGGQPLLQLSIECQAGLPTPTQLKQGNTMTVLVEYVANPPEDLVQLVKSDRESADLQVLISLPHSEKEPFLDFPGGRLNGSSFIEPPLTTLRTVDEATQTGDTSDSRNSGRYAPVRHWASIRKNWTDLPRQAAIVSSSTPPDMEEPSEVFGDASEAYANALCGDNMISWDVLHRKYIPMESYKKMLTRLSQDVIWPVEVLVTTQRSGTNSPKKEKVVEKHVQQHAKKKKKKGESHRESEDYESVSGVSMSNDNGETEDSDIFYMNELGAPPATEMVIVYHGIAFMDLSRLVYPGVQAVRFACKLYPFSQALLMSKTCLTKSAFDQTIKAAAENLSSQSRTMSPEGEEFSLQTRRSDEGPPYIVFEINLKRAIIPLYKTPSEIPQTVQDYIPPREIPRRKLISARVAQQRFRKAVLEAAAEVSAEYTNHYWKDVVAGNKEKNLSADELKKGFVFYLNASGRYLILREHLRQAVSQIVQQRCLNLRPSGFQSHREFQSYLHDMYTYLLDEIHETLSRTAFQEVDPLGSIPEAPNDNICSQESGGKGQFKAIEQKIILRELLFYAEESLAQGDFDNCHRLHLQRISRSKEAPQCWVDFAIMWLSRGDDRMAEIAVREALRSEPKNIHALMIGGIIAVRHNDERGIECLSSALGLRPQCPEILVILGVALAMVNNEMASDYFFRKAAYLHRALTGQNTDDLDKTFDKISKSVGVKQSVSNIVRAQDATIKPPSPIDEVIDKEEDTSKSLAPASIKSKPRRKSSGARKLSQLKIPSLNPRRMSKDRKMSTRKTLKRKSMNMKVHEARPPFTDEDLETELTEADFEEEEETLYTKRESISGQNPRKSAGYQPRFDFATDVSNIVVEDAILPPLRPSLIIQWNVTEFTDKMKAFLEAANTIPSVEPEIASDEVIKAEYDKIVTEDEEGEEVSPHNSAEGSNRSNKSPTSPAKEESSSKRHSAQLPETENKRHSVDRRRDSDNGSKQNSADSGNREKVNSADSTKEHPLILEKVPSRTPENEKLNELKEVEESTNLLSETNEIEANPTENDKAAPKQQVYMKRLGSELVWTAQLLLQMRMFDMLDGVLARELYISGTRSVQFLYLRAMSLYLRQSQQEAIQIVQEAIKLDSENPVFWIIKGHCHYEIGQNSEAVTCYETALKLPVGKENRHLLYLRYGSLSMDGANSETAKKVFLHGIQKYPTPYMWLATGNTCYLMGDYDEAEASFTEANRLDNTNPITWAHLALINLTKGQQALAEQSYKWALRFGLKKGKIMDEIKRLQEEKGFGDPSFPRVPNCIPHDYYVRRLGRQRPFDIYRDALINDPPGPGKARFDDTEREKELKRRLQENAECGQAKPESEVPEQETAQPDGETEIPEPNNDASLEIAVPEGQNSSKQPNSAKSSASKGNKPGKQPVSKVKAKKSLEDSDSASKRPNKKSNSKQEDNQMKAAANNISGKPGVSGAPVDKQANGTGRKNSRKKSSI